MQEEKYRTSSTSGYEPLSGRPRTAPKPADTPQEPPLSLWPFWARAISVLTSAVTGANPSITSRRKRDLLSQEASLLFDMDVFDENHPVVLKSVAVRDNGALHLQSRWMSDPLL